MDYNEQDRTLSRPGVPQALVHIRNAWQEANMIESHGETVWNQTALMMCQQSIYVNWEKMTGLLRLGPVTQVKEIEDLIESEKQRIPETKARQCIYYLRRAKMNSLGLDSKNKQDNNRWKYRENLGSAAKAFNDTQGFLPLLNLDMYVSSRFHSLVLNPLNMISTNPSGLTFAVFLRLAWINRFQASIILNLPRICWELA